MKVCAACNELKPLDAFGWRYKGTEKERQEARCKPCRVKATTLYKKRKREQEKINTYEETACPCDMCFKQTNCDTECASFRTWEEYGV